MGSKQPEREVMSLPDGRSTTSTTRYAREWRRWGKVICAAYGPKWVLYAFDPGMAIIMGGPREELTWRTMRVLYRALTEEPKRRKVKR